MPGLLGYPIRIGMGGDASQVDTSCSQLDEEENIQRFQPNCFNREEIAGQHLVFVMIHELTPADGTIPNGSGYDAMPIEDIANRGERNLNTQFLQLAFNLAVSPTAVFLSQTKDEFLGILADFGTAGVPFVVLGPLAANQLTVPLEDSCRLKEADDSF